MKISIDCFLNFISTRPLSQLSVIGTIFGVIYGLTAQHVILPREVILILQTPGKLFINSLKCIVLILVMLIMTRTPMDMNELSNATTYSAVTITYFFFSTLFASFFGLAMVKLIKPGGNTIGCEISSKTVETVTNVSRTKTTVVETVLSLGDQMVPSNAGEAIVNDNLLGVLVISLALGFAMAKFSDTKGGKYAKSLLIFFYDSIILILMTIVSYTPLGLLSIIGSEIAKIDDNCIFAQTTMYLVTFISASLIFIIVYYPAVYLIFVRANPLSYVRHFTDAYFMAISASSSAASLPLNIKGARETRVDQNIVNFVLPLGATLNMNGTIMYYIITINFIQYLEGGTISFGKQIVVCGLGTVVTMASPPVGSGGILYLFLVTEAADIHMSVKLISIIWAVDPVTDRICTITNVMGDSFAAPVIEVLSKYFVRKNKKSLNKEIMAVTPDLVDINKKENGDKNEENKNDPEKGEKMA